MNPAVKNTTNPGPEHSGLPLAPSHNSTGSMIPTFELCKIIKARKPALFLNTNELKDKTPKPLIPLNTTPGGNKKMTTELKEAPSPQNLRPN